MRSGDTVDTFDFCHLYHYNDYQQYHLSARFSRGLPMARISYKPESYHTATPYLIVKDVGGLLKFLVQVFDAKEVNRMQLPDGQIMHADVMIGDSHIMIGHAMDESGFPGMVYMYFPDCDAVYQRAIDAGATSMREPQDEAFGDRTAGVRDPFGNHWGLATHIGHTG